MANLFDKFEVAAEERAKGVLRNKLIRPIVELFPIEKVKAKEDWSIFAVQDTDGNAITQTLGLKKYLQDTKSGVYVFFNSSGAPLYVGQVGKSGRDGKQTNDLWNEVNQAFNRPGISRTIYRYRANLDEKFRPMWEQGPKVVPDKSKKNLCDVASSFSAYEIATGMAGPIEAVLIRGMANILLNNRLENF